MKPTKPSDTSVGLGFLRIPLLEKLEREDAIQELYKQGASVEDLSKEFDLSERHIRKIVGA